MSPPGLRRVLVALDVATSGGGAAAGTAELAAALGAELEALFVEDVELLRAAGLPLAAELALPSGAARALDREALEAQLGAFAAAAREALSAAALSHRLAFRFRVARGNPAGEFLAAAGPTDLLVLGRDPRLGRRGTTGAVASRAGTPVLVLGRGGGTGGPRWAVYGGSPSCDRALELAARLAGGAAGLTLLLAAATAGEAEQLAARARARLPPGRAPATRWLGGARRADLVRAAGRSGALLLMGAGSPVLAAGGLERLLDELDAAVLVTR
ncbi:MAG TPA: universal stress protein [Anaeromyxobacteraceae bacterium]